METLVGMRGLQKKKKILFVYIYIYGIEGFTRCVEWSALVWGVATDEEIEIMCGTVIWETSPIIWNFNNLWSVI